MAHILDCTTRDGGHTTNWNFEKDYVISLMKRLNEEKFTYYEIGYRNHIDNEGKGDFYKCTPEFLKPYYENKGNLKLGIMTDTKRYCESDFPEAKNDYADFVRIAGHPDKIKETLEIAYNLYQKGYTVFVQLMDVPNITAEGYIALFEYKHKEILESLYLADSYGVLTPDEIPGYFCKLKTLGYDKISFHAHNNSGFALENSLAAIKSGAFSVDVTENGLGRCGGNLNGTELIEALNR